MERKSLVIPVALVLAMFIGVAGYYAVAQALGAGKVEARPPAGPDRQKELLERVKHLEKQVAALKARPPLAEELQDEKVRDRLADVMAEARKRDRQAEEAKQAAKRAAERSARVVTWYRDRYRRMLADAREKTKVGEDKWKGLDPVFDKHFAPVAAAIKVKAAGGGRYVHMGRGEISTAVAAVLPATLAALKKTMPADTWKAFDKWRREPQTSRWGQNTRGEYFLVAGELKGVQAQAATERRWGTVKRALPELKLAADKQEKFHELMRGHITGFTAAFNGRAFVNVADEANRARIKKLAVKTDAQVKKLLGADDLAKYEKWKKDPGNRIGIYFGEERARQRIGRQNVRGWRRDRNPQPQAPKTQPAPPKQGEVF